MPGGVLSSGMEYPGRYSRWHVAYVDPPVEITAAGRTITVRARNDRGLVLLPVLAAALGRAGEVTEGDAGGQRHRGGPRRGVHRGGAHAGGRRCSPRCARSSPTWPGRTPTSACTGRSGTTWPSSSSRCGCGRPAPGGQRDLVLHLPDRIWVLDRKRETAVSLLLRVRHGGAGRPAGCPGRPPARRPGTAGRRLEPVSAVELPADPVPGGYAGVVGEARERFAAGDLFEVDAQPRVPRPVRGRPPRSSSGCGSATRPRTSSSSTSAAAEYLVGASPEMYVRVTGDRVETCPIAGTIARGADPHRRRRGHPGRCSASPKEESELTMCTDVDRNDKSRICVPGSIKVIGRRQIELYSRLIHTVDHIEGAAAAGLRRARRVPDPHVGGHGHRRAEGLGHAVHRGPRGRAAALVRRRRRHDRLRRRHEHRADPAHRAHPRRGRGGPGRGDAAVRLRPGRPRSRRPGSRPGRCWRRWPRPGGARGARRRRGGPAADRPGRRAWSRAARRLPGLVRAHAGRLPARAGRRR